MEFVQTLNNIKSNIEIINRYLDEKHEPEYSYAIKRIRLGFCFIAVKTSCGYRFYPSRFIGYVDNTMFKHENNDNRDGRKTTPAITQVLKQKNLPNSLFEEKYKLYCEELDITPIKRKRTFWELVD